MIRYLIPIGLVSVMSIVAAAPAAAWKPSTHVYLALQAMDEISNEVDLLGQPKARGEVVFYRVVHSSGEILERIGSYPARPELVDAIEAHRKAFVLGVLGPDAYPDIATGQQRIHVRHPVYSDQWLAYLWDRAQDENEPMIMAFVLGYLAHGIGDAFMHTYVNHFAGGPFAVDVTRAGANPLNFNAARHVIFESYIGKRAPDVDVDDYKIGDELEEPLREFMYRHLVDARTVDHPELSPRSDTFFGERVMVSKPYVGPSNGELDYESALPRYFSDLRDVLVGYLNTVDDTVAAIDARIQDIYDAAAAQSCPANVRCDSPIEDKPAACIAGCAAAGALTTPHLAQKTAFQAAHAAPYTYVRQEWVPNIDRGLREWLDLNHEIARLLMFAPEGASDLQAIRDSAAHYRDVVLPGMLGAPGAVGALINFTRSVEEMAFGGIQTTIDALREDVLRMLFIWAFQMTPETFRDLYVSPQAVFDDVLPLAYTGEAGEEAVGISLAQLNAMLGIDDPGYAFPERRWDPLKLPPAWNTMTLIKMSMLSDAGLRSLFEDLGVPCGNNACLPGSNPALGFLRSLDESLQWLPEHPSDAPDDPLFAAFKSTLDGFVVEECGPYAQIFMEQLGDLSAAYQTNGRIVEARPCAPFVALDPPVITPDGGEFGAPVTVALTPPDGLSPEVASGLSIYYTMQVNGVTVEPVRSADGTIDSRVHRYVGPFQVSPPLDPALLPITVRARAYHPDYLPSASAVAAFDVDARLDTPLFSRADGDYLEPFSVAINLPNDPGGSGIYYTLTGENPDYNDTPYTGPISLTRGAHELRAVAYRPGFVRSDVAAAAFRVFAPDDVERADPPVFTSPRGSGTYADDVTVAIETNTQGGVIRWTSRQDQVPAFVPTATLGNAYTGPFPLPKGNWFIYAVTVKDGVFDSEVAQIRIDVVDPLGTTSLPSVSPPGGTFDNDVEVRLAAAVSFVNVQGQAVTDSNGIQIQYTLDGTDPDIDPGFNPVSNRRYTQPFTLRRSSTLRALAYRTFFPISDFAVADFRFVAAPPVTDPGPGTYFDSVRVTLASNTQNAIIRYTLDGSDPTELSTSYSEPILLTSGATVRSRAFRTGYEFSEVAEAAFDVQTSAPPTIVRQPVAVEAIIGRSVELSVRGEGTPEPTYQWFFEGTAVSGATNDTLHIASVSEADAGLYVVTLSSEAGQVTSEEVLLTVIPEPITPVITTDLPEVLEVGLGEAASFGVETTGAPAATYRWFRNGKLLSGMVSDRIAYSAADLAHAGAYQVVAENLAGRDTSVIMQFVILLAANVSAEDAGEVPHRFELGQNYPNPFNPLTAIPFAVPEQARVRLTLYDVAGRRVAVLVDRDFAAGRYTAHLEADDLASGVYFYRLEAGRWSDVKKLVLLR